MVIWKYKLKNQGSYGSVYKAIWNDNVYLLKQNDEFDVINLYHEFSIAKELQKTFCKTFFCEPVHFFVNSKGVENLLMRWIEHEGTMWNLVDKLSDENVINIFCHLCKILNSVQKSVEFVHYDLHLNNILLVKTNEKFFTYDDGITVPFVRYKPVIIDYGFSHCSNVNGCNSVLTQTHIGMHPMIFNPYYDYITLIIETFTKNYKQKIQDIFRHQLNNDGSLRLQMSLFDYLSRICGCSEYERLDEKPFEKKYKKDDYIDQTKMNHIKLKNLLCKVQNNLNDPTYLPENTKQKFMIWDETLVVSDSLKNDIVFHINMYNDYYEKHLKTVYDDKKVYNFIMAPFDCDKLLLEIFYQTLYSNRICKYGKPLEKIQNVSCCFL
jgi:hypothetical protein